MITTNKIFRNFLCGIILSISITRFNYAQVKTPAPFGPLPNENQIRWQEMEYYAFLHFSLNIYTDQSWGYGNEQEYIRLGQKVKAFTIEALIDGKWKGISTGTTIGYKRILRFPTVKATQVCLLLPIQKPAR